VCCMHITITTSETCKQICYTILFASTIPDVIKLVNPPVLSFLDLIVDICSWIFNQFFLERKTSKLAITLGVKICFMDPRSNELNGIKILGEEDDEDASSAWRCRSFRVGCANLGRPSRFRVVRLFPL
jgi:hypothetical protein